MWEPEPAPAGFSLFGIPNTAQRKVEYAVRIPWVLGIIATRSFNQQVPGIKQLIAEDEARIRDGLIAQEVIAWEGYYEPGPVDFRKETITELIAIGNGVPAWGSLAAYE